MDRRRNEWIEGGMNGWTKGWINERRDGRMSEKKDERMEETLQSQRGQFDCQFFGTAQTA